MTDTKTTANGNKAIVKANQTALKGFPKGKLKSAFELMAAKANDGDDSNDARQVAALDVCVMAVNFRAKNDAVTDLTTVVQGWRDSIKVLAMELAIAGNRFAELREAKGDKPASAKLTGYGDNVASIAKGCIEHEIAPSDSYRETRKAVEAARNEARRAADPNGALLADAKAEADTAWGELREVIFDLGEVAPVESLTEWLNDQREQVAAEIAERIKAEAEADKAKAEADALPEAEVTEVELTTETKAA